MKRYDIEIFVKSTLQEYTLKPNESSWMQLLEQLQKQEQKKDQMIIFRKTALLITVFLAGFGSVRNKSIQHLDIPRVANSGIISTIADSEVGKDSMVFLVTGNNDFTFKDDQGIVKEKTPQPDVLSDETSSPALDEVFTANKKSTGDLNSSTGIKVTDAEIETLMRKARENIEKKRILLKQQEILLAQEFLADAIDIEEKIEPKVNSTDVGLNKYLRKLLKIKSAFAN